MIQGGDPNTKDNDFTNDGQGNSPSRVNAEFSQVHHARGILSMARANDPNSASCQFFICVAEAAFLDGKYTVFGQVTDGIDIVDKIVNLRDVTTRPHSAISSQGINPGRAAEVFQMAVVEDSSDEKANKKLAAAERKRNQIVVADEAKMKYQEKQATSERKKADALLSPNVIARLASRFKDADQAADIVFHINAALGMEYSSFNPMLLNLAALSGSNDDIKKYFQKELQLNPPLNSLQLESLSQSTGLSYDELTAFQVK
jgi:cyclophilin family peptidyl-prolyl cis-trans isomerase